MSFFKRLLFLLLIASPLQAMVPTSPKLSLYQPAPVVKTPEDAFIYWFPFIDRIRLINIKNYSVKLDYQQINIHYRGVPIPDSKIKVELSYITAVNFATQVGYMNGWDPNRWVFFFPRSYSVGISPFTNNYTNMMLLKFSMRVL